MQLPLGFAPERHEKQAADGAWLVTVTPPQIVGQDGGATVRLDLFQFKKYLCWRAGFGPEVQETFPELSADEREALRSGLRPETFAAIAGDEP